MKWKEIKEICKQYNMTFGHRSINFVDIPATKNYFKRRPKYSIFDYSPTSDQKDEDPVIVDSRYLNYTHKNVDCAMVYNKPMEIKDMPDWVINEFMDKGKLSSGFFRWWSNRDKQPINTKEEFKAAIEDFMKKMELYKNLSETEELKSIRKMYLENDKKRLELEIQNNKLKKNYVQSFKKHAGIIEDF